MELSTTARIITIGAGVLVGLTACTSATTAPTTLVETKSPTQLLRNVAAQRLMTGTDESIAEQQDYSAACKSGAEDPDGLWRAWHSSLLATVPPDSAIGVDQFVGALATSFAEDDWRLSEEHGNDSALKVTTMTKSSSIVTLRFTSTEDRGEGATIYIEASGPCVLTGGPDSDEVTSLEL